MAKPVDFKDGIGRKELQLVRRRFLGLQRERLRRIEAALSPLQRDYLNLLPLLFHINHPLMPGYVSSETPAGIADYSPTQALVRTARKITRSFSYTKRAQRTYPIRGVYLMGSIGSIAHTTGSDFDVWLCHDPHLQPEELLALREKSVRLEAWARELALEVHIFVIDTDAFRRGSRPALSRESSGSTQKQLLLEEFYRTGILLAGLHPLWWLVPPDQENNYTEYTAWLLERRFVSPRDCIDFGGLENTPADEFFGAAHWQLYKGIEAPYKAILKLLLIESYSRDYPDIRWLCQEAKAALYAGNLDVNELDPYIVMYRRVEQYLLERDQPERLALARRCFYFKTEQALSRKSPRRGDEWQRELLSALVKEWRWGKAELVLLDTRPEWKIDQILEERNTLVRELTRSYRVLTQFSRTFATSGQIDPEELNLLGRKLYTALERQPGKVDSINPGISRDPVEKRLSLHYHRNSDGSERWLLYRGEMNEAAVADLAPVKTTAGLIEMLAWIHLNGLANRDTALALFPANSPVSLRELHTLLSNLRQFYPSGHPKNVRMEALSQPPYAISCALFVNTGIDPMAHLTKEGKQLTSDRSDPLSFGAGHACLVESLESLMITSWGEVLITCQHDSTGLGEALCHYLNATLQLNPDEEPPPVTACGYSSVRASAIAQRVAQLFNHASYSFGPNGVGIDARYLFHADDDYYLVQNNGEEFDFFSLASKEELLQELGQPQPRFRPLGFDRETLRDTPLPLIFQHNREDQIQIFHFVAKNEIELYILDEEGALFYQTIRGSSEQQLLSQQHRFFQELVLLRSLRSQQHDPQLLLATPEYFKILRNHNGEWSLDAHTPPRIAIGEEHLDLRLVTEGLDLQTSPHLLVCGDQEFSSLEYGELLPHIAADFILQKRRPGETYPIYLSGLQLTGTTTDLSPTTIELLNLKKRLEQRLNQALQEIIA